VGLGSYGRIIHIKWVDEWILLQDGLIVYVSLFAMLLAGSIGLPIPEDLPLILGGILVQQGKAKIELVLVVCYIGILVGDLVIYSAGRTVGPALFNRKWFRLSMPPERIEKVKAQLEKRSILMIFVARHLFYLRTVTFLTCGAVKMKFSHFLIADAIAALISAPLMIGLGYLAAENYQVILEWINRLKFYLVIPLSIAGLFAYLWYRKKRDNVVPNGSGSM